jgi:hypothetical protein
MSNDSRRSNLPPGMVPLPTEGRVPEPSKATAAQRRLVKAAAKRTTGASRRTRIPYGESVADRLLEHIIAGGSLLSFCSLEGNPNKSSDLRWLREKPVFRAQYARAREMQRDHLLDEMIHIADTDPDARRARVRIEARKWLVGRLMPKKYGRSQ